jgi:hypothetical protein
MPWRMGKILRLISTGGRDDDVRRRDGGHDREQASGRIGAVIAAMARTPRTVAPSGRPADLVGLLPTIPEPRRGRTRCRSGTLVSSELEAGRPRAEGLVSATSGSVVSLVVTSPAVIRRPRP